MESAKPRSRSGTFCNTGAGAGLWSVGGRDVGVVELRRAGRRGVGSVHGEWVENLVWSALGRGAEETVAIRDFGRAGADGGHSRRGGAGDLLGSCCAGLRLSAHVGLFGGSRVGFFKSIGLLRFALAGVGLGSIEEGLGGVERRRLNAIQKIDQAFFLTLGSPPMRQRGQQVVVFVVKVNGIRVLVAISLLA